MIDEYLKKRDEIPGWFSPGDIQVFMALNEIQKKREVSGDILEIGAYCGKSAALLGYFIGGAESLFVCDLFGETAETPIERHENETYYGGLTFETFARNYRRFHADMPHVLRCSSTDLSQRQLTKSFRLIHVDGSHQYEVVRKDIQTVKELLLNGGVVIFDDYRSFHTPGVAAAVWPELLNGDLRPLCITSLKLYAVVGSDQHGIFSELETWAQGSQDMLCERDIIGGKALLRLAYRQPQVSLVRKIYWEIRSSRRQGQPVK